tara:strand:+ start:1068 stop:1679 length:612 start_codon:yes stop_codon:yes gene_type:complete
MTFGLVKHNNNSISAITSAGQLAQGKMTLLQTQTASSSSSIDFTSNIDSTYPIYVFKFINIHPATNDTGFMVGFRDGSTAYDASKTTTAFRSFHDEANSSTNLTYYGSVDQANATGFQYLTGGTGNGNDECLSGILHLFEPSSTTFVKHFIARTQEYNAGDASQEYYMAGYCNTTTAIDGVQFKFASGNIDSGTIKLYGIKGS